MLSGRRAFHHATAVETLNAILNEEPSEHTTFRVEVPQALGRVVDLCLEKKREERVHSAHDVALALEALAGIAPAAMPRIEARHVPAKWRVRVALGAGLLCATIGAAGYLAGHRTGKASPPIFQRLTSQRGFVGAARFAPDGQTIVYSAAWAGDSLRLFTTRIGSPEVSRLDLPVANLASVSSSGEMLLQLRPSNVGLNLWFGTLARSPLAGGAPREIVADVAAADWSPDGSRVAVVRRVGGKFRLEFPAGKLLYETQGYISEPRVSPQGEHVAFLHHPAPGDDAGSVEVVDLSGGVRTLSAGWISAVGLAWSPRGKEVWFSAAEKGSSRNLYAVSLAGERRLLLTIPGGTVLRDVSPRGKVLLVRENRSLDLIGLAPGETRERGLSWLDFSFACDLSADGRTLLFGEQGEGVGPKYAVCLRKTSGSPVVRLGEGLATALSPDGKWALAVQYSPSDRLQLLPTSAGEQRTLEPGSIVRYQWANWMPDGRRIVLSGFERDHGMRCYIQDLNDGPPRPITPEGTQLYYPCSPVSPDGRFLVAKDARENPALYPLEGGAPRPVLGLTSADWPLCWSADGRFLFVQRSGEIPARIDRLDPRTGDRKPWKNLSPPDPAGVTQISGIRISADESSYVYSVQRTLDDLYLVEGLR